MKTQLKTQWQIYKELELIPTSVPEPQANKQTFALLVGGVWRMLIDTLARELVFEQQVEYLERCLAVNCSEPGTATRSNTWQKVWTLIN